MQNRFFKRAAAAFFAAALCITALPQIFTGAAAAGFTRGDWSVAGTSYTSPNEDYGKDFTIIQLGEGGDFTVSATVAVDRTANQEFGFIFGMRDKNNDNIIGQESDFCYVLEQVGSQGQFGLAKVDSTWTGWMKSGTAVAKSPADKALESGEWELTLTVSGKSVELTCRKGTLLKWELGEAVSGGFGLCTKKLSKQFRNTRFTVGALQDTVVSDSPYGGSWAVDGSTYTSTSVPAAPDFSFYALGSTESDTLSIRLCESFKLTTGDTGMLFGVSNRNGNDIIEENVDSYYLVNVTRVSDAGEFSVFIEKNEAVWSGAVQKKVFNGASVGGKVTLEVLYEPSLHRFTVSVNGEQAIEWTDAVSPLTGKGYGLASKVKGSGTELTSVVCKKSLEDGKYLQSRESIGKNGEKLTDFRIIFVTPVSFVSEVEAVKITASFKSGSKVYTFVPGAEDEITTVYGEIRAGNGNGSYDEYSAGDDSVIFGVTIKGAPSDSVITDAAAYTSGSAPVLDSPKTITKLGNVKIAGNDIKDYKIVYADSPYTDAQIATFNTGYDYFKTSAERVAESIFNRTGIKLPVVRDSDTTVSGLEILVGPTNRTESGIYRYMNSYRYLNTVRDGKLLIGGGFDVTPLAGGDVKTKASYSFAAVYHAWESIDKLIDRALFAGQSVLSLDEGWSASGSFDFTTVSFIGDSITEGTGSDDRTVNSYPAVLQRTLWQDFIMINCGNSGKTMRSDLDQRYKGTTPYNAALGCAYYADLTFIMLGTNDSYFDKGFDSTDDARYTDSALELAAELAARNPEVKLTIMNCPAFYGDNTSGDLHIRALQAALVPKLQAKGYNTYFFDMNGFTDKYVTSARFPDALHPGNEGYTIIAAELARIIPAMLDGSYSTAPAQIDEKAAAPAAGGNAAGSVNLLPVRLDAKYLTTKPMASKATEYARWSMNGAPYIFKNQSLFAGHVITDIDMPVYYAKPGEVFTVSVIKYTYPNITETVSEYKLTAKCESGFGWISFHGLDIEVPEGCTLAFGSSSDTLRVLFLTPSEAGYGFYGSKSGSDNSTTLAFNVYGRVSG